MNGRQTANQEKMAILSEAREIAQQDQKQLDMSRVEWEAALSQAQQSGEEKLRHALEADAHRERNLRDEQLRKSSEERKLYLSSKNSEVERLQRDAEHERERAIKAERVAEAAIRVGDEEKRAAELGRKEAEDEARRAVERAQKAKGVAEAAIRLGEMEKQAALAAKKEAEEKLREAQNAFDNQRRDIEQKYKREREAWEKDQTEKERELEEADKEEETIPVLEAKLAMMRQMEEEEQRRKAGEEAEERSRAEEEARKFMEREKLAAEKRSLRDHELMKKEKEKQRQLEWTRNQERVKAAKQKKLEAAEERLFEKAKRMDVLDRGAQ